ncbi:MAG: hypothetical protein KKC26_05545, partial [Nanoarchaeota archaeon]|nr:hypothetical protein [Nanoarchaeota archaeon]MBU1850417.1 hypothetical protein [Nanoarchaeota archaeon]
SYKSINNASLFSDYSLLAERYNLPFMSVKQQAIYFTKGLIGGSKIRSKLVKCKNISELKVIMAIV